MKSGTYKCEKERRAYLEELFEFESQSDSMTTSPSVKSQHKHPMQAPSRAYLTKVGSKLTASVSDEGLIFSLEEDAIVDDSKVTKFLEDFEITSDQEEENPEKTEQKIFLTTPVVAPTSSQSSPIPITSAYKLGMSNLDKRKPHTQVGSINELSNHQTQTPPFIVGRAKIPVKGGL